MGKRIGRIKPIKFKDQDKRTLIGITKLTWKQNKELFHYFPSEVPSSQMLQLIMISCGMEYPSGKFGSAVPGYVSSQFFAHLHPTHEGERMGKRLSFVAV